MKQLRAALYVAFVVLGIAAVVIGCGGNSPSPAVVSTAPPLPTVAAATEPTDAPEPTTASASASSADACSILNASEIGAITRVTYDSTNSQGSFPNIKHCEYRGQANVVSLLLAEGVTATERMNSSKLLAHTILDAFHDEAIWEPVKSQLTVLSGGRLVEIRISKSHGDEAARIENAKTLANLLFSRF